MRILGISAGTKDGTNDSMCKEALMAAKELGAEVKFINLYDLDIQHCTGCVACSTAIFTTGKKICVLKDDFPWLCEQMLEADGIIFSVPIFEKGAPGIFHTVTDRFGPSTDRGILTEATKIAKERGGNVPDQRWLKDKVISYMAFGGSDWMSKVQCDCGLHALSPAWKIIQNEVFSWSTCCLTNEAYVARAHKVGENLAKAAADMEHAVYQGEPGICPHCHGREFYFHPDNVAECCLCGIRGRIASDGDGYKFIFDESELNHAHDTLPGKMSHSKDVNNNVNIILETKKSLEYKEKVAMYKQFITGSKPEK